MKTLQDIWLKNEYPLNRCNKTFLDKIFIKKDIVATVPKKEFNLVLPFLGQQSIYIKTKLKTFFSSKEGKLVISKLRFP